jgi:hypothetical protein
MNQLLDAMTTPLPNRLTTADPAAWRSQISLAQPLIALSSWVLDNMGAIQSHREQLDTPQANVSIKQIG